MIQVGEMVAKTRRKKYIGVRLDESMLARIDQQAEGLHGLKAPRSEVIRIALERGLDALEKETGKKKK